MKKMRLKKTVLSVALAMSGLCTIPVTQAADALEELQNLGTQVATIKYGDIMDDISKAIAEGNIDVVPQALDDLISLNQSVIDREVLQYQKLIDTSKTVLQGGGLSAEEAVKLRESINNLIKEQQAIQTTGANFVYKINEYKASAKNAISTGVKVLGYGFDIYEIGKEVNKARKEMGLK